MKFYALRLMEALIVMVIASPHVYITVPQILLNSVCTRRYYTDSTAKLIKTHTCYSRLSQDICAGADSGAPTVATATRGPRQRRRPDFNPCTVLTFCSGPFTIALELACHFGIRLAMYTMLAATNTYSHYRLILTAFH